MKALAALAAACLLCAPAHAEEAAPAPNLSLLGAVLNAVDIDRVLAFYTEGLGLTLAMKMPVGKVNEYMLTFGGNAGDPGLILWHDANIPTPLDPGTAYNRVVVRVSDLDAVAARLRANGYEHAAIRDVAHGYRMLMVSDPEGHRLELVQSGGAQHHDH